jgi:hypothetical protein
MALRGGAATATKLECGVVGVLCPVKPAMINSSVGIRSFVAALRLEFYLTYRDGNAGTEVRVKELHIGRRDRA